MTWISVHNVLPAENHHVLTFTPDNVRMPIKVNYIVNGEFIYGHSENITHWMLLPSKPGEI